MSSKKENYTPMMTQYLEIKENYPDTLIFYRLGDFYEMFFEDAKIASRELELVLTGRNAGVSERVPMCGVPFHSVNTYLERLIEKGYKIGIVEQLEDPKDAVGIVKRDVVQIITPGTLIDMGLKENKNNFLLSVEEAGNEYIISSVDLSTGDMRVSNINKDITSLVNEILKHESKEIVIARDFDSNDLKILKNSIRVAISYQDEKEDDEFVLSITKNIKDLRQIKSINRLYHYLLKTQRRDLNYLKEVEVENKLDYLQMDNFSRNNLEILRTSRNEDRYGSLLWVLDKCKTAMGSRMLKRWLINPLYKIEKIEERLKVVDSFVSNYEIRTKVIDLLKEIYDLERLVARISYGNANAKDLIQLKKSLLVVPTIKEILKDSGEMDLFVLSSKIENFDDISHLLEKSIEDEPPFTIKEGGIIKSGYSTHLDELKDMAHNGKKIIAEIELKEKEKTGIKSLKVGYNRVFGYYIEVTNSYLDLVKDEYGYVRKQTLSNAERFITSELKEKEEMVLKAQEKSIALEYDLFLEIRGKIKERTSSIQKLADILSSIDVLSDFALISIENKYNRPTFNNEGKFVMKNLRHPVLEKLIGEENFIKNNFYIDNEHFFDLITGPNMGGKSTIMRQVVLSIVMAQIGCYVAAEKAELSLVDKVFTRIGASDDLVSGNSTFMIEMIEANNALKNATKDSFIVFDEIGRGTSTYDGMALAQAIIEYICLDIKAKTLFSTHYHELTYLEDKIEGLVNKSVSVYEENDAVTFLYKLVDGPINKSYGVNVARLAHLPTSLIKRANDILENLENGNHFSGIKKEIIIKEVVPDYIKDVEKLDPINMSPMEALNYLYELKKKIK